MFENNGNQNGPRGHKGHSSNWHSASSDNLVGYTEIYRSPEYGVYYYNPTLNRVGVVVDQDSVQHKNHIKQGGSYYPDEVYAAIDKFNNTNTNTTGRINTVSNSKIGNTNNSGNTSSSNGIGNTSQNVPNSGNNKSVPELSIPPVAPPSEEELKQMKQESLEIPEETDEQLEEQSENQIPEEDINFDQEEPQDSTINNEEPIEESSEEYNQEPENLVNEQNQEYQQNNQEIQNSEIQQSDNMSSNGISNRVRAAISSYPQKSYNKNIRLYGGNNYYSQLQSRRRFGGNTPEERAENMFARMMDAMTGEYNPYFNQPYVSREDYKRMGENFLKFGEAIDWLYTNSGLKDAITYDNLDPNYSSLWSKVNMGPNDVRLANGTIIDKTTGEIKTRNSDAAIDFVGNVLGIPLLTRFLNGKGQTPFGYVGEGYGEDGTYYKFDPEMQNRLALPTYTKISDFVGDHTPDAVKNVVNSVTDGGYLNSVVGNAITPYYAAGTGILDELNTALGDPLKQLNWVDPDKLAYFIGTGQLPTSDYNPGISSEIYTINPTMGTFTNLAYQSVSPRTKALSKIKNGSEAIVKKGVRNRIAKTVKSTRGGNRTKAQRIVNAYNAFDYVDKKIGSPLWNKTKYFRFSVGNQPYLVQNFGGNEGIKITDESTNTSRVISNNDLAELGIEVKDGRIVASEDSLKKLRELISKKQTGGRIEYFKKGKKIKKNKKITHFRGLATDNGFLI